MTSDLLFQIRQTALTQRPKHVAIIMDGNGRWAKQQGKERIFGHQHGVQAVRNALESAGEAEIPYLTLYAFSTENWNRPQTEVDALTALLVKSIHLEIDNLMANNVKLLTIGDINSFPEECRKELQVAIRQTANNQGVTLILALSYSGRWELTEMAKQVAMEVQKGLLNPTNITSSLIPQYLSTQGIPDPDILIRTGGEHRISNFLLWQMAYTEFFFLKKMWPEFQKEDFWQVILDYMSIQRRFGKTGDQVECSENIM
jgi:undecaprenyl diphosphate synthase